MLLLCFSIALSLLGLIIVILFSLQNSAAQIIICTPSRERITPVLQLLHWLPFKISLLTFKSIRDLAPPYLCYLVHITIPFHSFRSLSASYLIVPSAQLTTVGHRAFSRSAPSTLKFTSSRFLEYWLSSLI